MLSIDYNRLLLELIGRLVLESQLQLGSEVFGEDSPAEEQQVKLSRLSSRRLLYFQAMHSII